MTNISVSTDDPADKALIFRRDIHVGDKTIETPTTAFPAGRASNQDTPAADSRGVNHLHRNIDTEMLKKSMRARSSAIADHLRAGHKKTHPDEVTIAFTSFQDAHQMGREEIEHLIDVLDPYTDILPVPMMPGLVGSIDRDGKISDAAFKSYRTTIERFIDVALERVPELPVMGIIPPLGWEFNKYMAEMYIERGIKAYGLNLNRSRITAGRQVAMVTPLMRHLALRDKLKGVFTYLVNPDPYGRKLSEAFRSAADLSAFGMGIDVIGDCHVSPGGFSKSDPDEEGGPVTIRLLNKDTYVYEDVPVDDLQERLPEDTGFNRKRVAHMAQNSESGLYKMQKLVNMEQLALGAKTLREQSRGRRFNHLAEKAGVTEDTIEVYDSVRSGVDDGDSQTGISDF